MINHGEVKPQCSGLFQVSGEARSPLQHSDLRGDRVSANLLARQSPTGSHHEVE